VFARGTLTFFEIAIVVLLIASLAALGCFTIRKRNRRFEILRVFLNQLDPDRQSSFIAR
jgi:hypothetical protein